MNPEITIKITVAPDGTKVSTGEQVLTAAEGPAPLALDQLQAGGFAAAPRPGQPEALQTVGVASETPLAPMSLETLQSYLAPEAPTPAALGGLEGVAAAPRPLLEPVAAGAQVPEPMPIEQLTSGEGEGKGRRR